MHGLCAENAFEAAADDEHGGAVHERPDCQHDAGVLARSASQALGDALAHEVERRPGLVQGRRLADAVKQHLVGVGVFEGKLEITEHGLANRAGAAECGEKIFASLGAQGAENIVAVAVALVDRGRRGGGRFGDGAHGEGFLAAAGPQARGSVENLLLQFRVRMPGHFASKGETNYLHCV